MIRRSCISSRVAAPAAVALAAGLAAPAAAVDKSWDANSGTWSTAGNWSPVGVPLSTDAVFIGNLAGVQNNTVWLDQDDSVTDLTISDGMTFRTDGFNFFVNGDAVVTGNNVVGPSTFRSSLRVNHVGLGPDMFTHTLRAMDGALVALSSDGYIQATDYVSIGADSSLRGQGTVELTGAGATFANNGTVAPEGGELVLMQTGGGLFDLDGVSAGAMLYVAANGAVQLTVQGGLTDNFDGSIALGANDRLHMATGTWTAGSPSTLRVFGSPGGGPSRITGSPLIFHGDAVVTGDDGHLRFESATTFTASSSIIVEPDNHAETTAAATINIGAVFICEEGATLDFDGSTRVEGGSFETFTSSPGQGIVSFNGATEWAGTIEVDGIARQNGAATVTAPTTINADGNFDMDGTTNPAWSIEAPLTINADGVEILGNSVSSPISITGSVSHLTVNLDGPGEGWIAAGAVTLGQFPGAPQFPVIRIAGSPVAFFGQVNVASGRPRITAPVTIDDTATVTITAAAAELRLDSVTTVEDSASFLGAGALVSGSAGVMTLEGGVSTGTVGLINNGTLQIDAAAGVASVNRFTNAAGATWRVSIGGTTQGSQYDHLIVSTGAATLDGNLEVDLIDLGGGVFEPQVGEDFTILTALGGVVGTFDNDPVSVVGSTSYEWSVQYGPNSVVLHLDSINECYPDCDTSTGAGVLDIFDFLCFQNLFDAGDPYACDADTSTGPGVCDIFDFLAFQNAYSAGCP